MELPVEKRIILDLCGGTGAWSRPYAEAGYDVRNITLPDYDVLTYQSPEEVYGILATPPCTYFCRMRMCRGRPTNEQFAKGLSTVDACLRIIWRCNPVFWALENPQGYLSRWLGQPILKFDPCDYGDPWTKRTWLWGVFNTPQKNQIKPIAPWIHRKKGKHGMSPGDKNNAITPPGFAQAFYEANK